MVSSKATAASIVGRAAPMFAALGDQRRLLIVSRLCERGPQSIVRLTSGTRVSRQAITKHLHHLARAGLVDSAREGRERIWRIRRSRLAEVHRSLASISDQWDAALERLRAAVETEDRSRAGARSSRRHGGSAR